MEIVHEHGAPALSVATVCKRAGVSRKTFYDTFADREACLLAAFEAALELATRAVSRSAANKSRWRARIGAGLGALLALFDSDPTLARLLIVEALSSGERTIAVRRDVLARIVAVVDEGRAEAKAGHQPPPLTAEGVVGAAFAIVHARILDHDQRQLTELAGPLMAMIVQPYLGAAAARRELEHPIRPRPRKVSPRPSNPFKDLPIRLTYRTARVLATIAATPGSSNKKIAATAGVSDEGQMSRLLQRLETHDLISNQGGEPASGEAKAWTLTPRGEGVLLAVGAA
jgi:AcrR family transcriptional regulator/DNA-binding MarR family transcriptional regulator